MRLFVALVPPQAALEDLEDFLSVRREAGPFRWTVAEQWHLTLAFMESVEDRHLDDLVERLRRAGRKRSAFDVTLAGGGAFPNPAHAKVLWAGVEAGPDLTRLATGARAAAAKAGARPDGGKHKPHLTLARIGKPQELSNWVRLLDSYRGPTWTAGEFALLESHLGEGPRKRPRHVVLERFNLES